jgi:tetratricopeptide (TPR) repeat protein
MTLNRFRAVIFLLIFPFFLKSQEDARFLDPSKIKMSKTQKEAFELGEEYFNSEYYLSALPIFKELEKDFPQSLYILYRLGVCYLYKKDETDKAVEYLKKVKDMEPLIVDIEFNLGRAYHLNYKFDDALNEFKQYSDRKIADVMKKQTELYIAYC